MDKLFRLKISPVNQYFIGLAFNILFIIILLGSNTSYANLQLPEGRYSENLWKGTDVLTYVVPARNFLQYGIFGNGNSPDYHRTIGYPLFLAGSMKIFGKDALYFYFFFQAALFAFIYPALSRIAGILFKDSQSNIAVPAFLFFLVSGTYISMVPVILTDLFFAVIFTIGLCFGLEAIFKKSWKYLILHILFIGYAAQVRPLLSVYPIINFFILLLVAKEYLILKNRKIQLFLIVSTISLLWLCNAPSIRNYINHRLSDPSDVLSNNMLDYLAKDVLNYKGEQSTYLVMKKKVNNVTNISEIVKLKKKLAIEVFRKYPVTTIIQLGYNAGINLIEPHWMLATKYYGYHYMDIASIGHMPLKKSNFGLIIFTTFVFINIVLWILFSFSLVYFIRSGKSMVLIPIIILIFYFIIPTFMSGQGSRMRLPAEGLMVLCTFYYLEQKLFPKTSCDAEDKRLGYN